MKKTFFLLLLSLSMILVGCGSSETSDTGSAQDQAGGEEASRDGGGESIEFGFGHAMAPDHPEHLAAVRMGEILDEETEGRIKVNVYPSAQLGGSRELMTGVQNGSVEMVATSTFGTVDQQQLVVNLPYLFEDFDHINRFVNSDISTDLLARLQDHNVYGLGFWTVGFRNIGNRHHPLETPADLNGLLIRAFEDEMLKDTLEALGADVTVMPITEVYTALQTGAIDGEENPYVITATQKFQEGYDYKTETRHLNNFEIVAANLDWWNGLTEDDQEMILTAYSQATEYYNQLQQEADEKYKQELIDDGLQINDIEDYQPWIDAVQPVYEKWEDTFGADLVNSIRELGWQ
ncbi:TRAP transporter substrate-binding protein [Alkalihalobacillus oceani]|uniref:TRAP transporter substrate-binding protein n=1 Tax=Halalkalibacter oceani TaxID=1653776 RepID=UPI0020423D67|nr:TRAP transporter substrate-binding protein [Halalkalibacter oceani]MCM3759942.1 TRAP transporter substrate-binding protein [Halalkalibacter oceani]